MINLYLSLVKTLLLEIIGVSLTHRFFRIYDVLFIVALYLTKVFWGIILEYIIYFLFHFLMRRISFKETLLYALCLEFSAVLPASLLLDFGGEIRIIYSNAYLESLLIMVMIIINSYVYLYLWDWMNYCVNSFEKGLRFCNIVVFLMTLYLFVQGKNSIFLKLRLVFYGQILIDLVKSFVLFSVQKTFEYNQSKEFEKSIDSIKSGYDQVRMINHDLKHEYLLLHSLLQQGDYEEISDILSKRLNLLDSSAAYLFTGNDILDAVLNSKINDAKKKGIHFNSLIDMDEMNKKEMLDVAMILCNLLDNAIINNDENKKIVLLRITQIGTNLNIVVENSTTAKEISQRSTIPETEHGIGLFSVQNIINKYDGIVENKLIGDIYRCEIKMSFNHINE